MAIVPWKDLPNYRDSIPTKLFEYLSLGIPVVASNLPGIRQVGVGNLAVILVEPENPAALAAGIIEALDEDQRARAGADVAMVRDRDRWPVREVTEFYRALAGR